MDIFPTKVRKNSQSSLGIFFHFVSIFNVFLPFFYLVYSEKKVIFVAFQI